MLHVLNPTQADKTAFAMNEGVDWAFCTPVESDACPGWAIYVAGDFGSRSAIGRAGGVDAGQMEMLQDDLKFTELTATTLGALRQVRALQRRQDSLRNFFAPVVLEALAHHDPDRILAPRETEVSVLFCDLRGFSQQSEGAADRLLELLQRVSDALGVMTHHILANDGVVGDFHGDAAMGFWGWPIDSNQSILRVWSSSAGHTQRVLDRIGSKQPSVGKFPGWTRNRIGPGGGWSHRNDRSSQGDSVRPRGQFGIAIGGDDEATTSVDSDRRTDSRVGARQCGARRVACAQRGQSDPLRDANAAGR